MFWCSLNKKQQTKKTKKENFVVVFIKKKKSPEKNENVLNVQKPLLSSFQKTSLFEQLIHCLIIRASTPVLSSSLTQTDHFATNSYYFSIWALPLCPTNREGGGEIRKPHTLNLIERHAKHALFARSGVKRSFSGADMSTKMESQPHQDGILTEVRVFEHNDFIFFYF